MNYIDYTKAVIEEHANSDGVVLVVGAGFDPRSSGVGLSRLDKGNILTNGENEPIDAWCENYKNSPDFRPLDLVVLSRVLEHFPVRNVDWYLYELYTTMAEDSELICVVPNMPEVVKRLQEQFRKEHVDHFRTTRLTYELFNEGAHVFDRHALWASEDSVRYCLELENLFSVKSVRKIVIDTDVVPEQLEFVAKRV